MSNRVLVALTASAAVGSGIVGGVFFAFSTFVMTALNKLQSAQSITAMQAINTAAPNVLFMAALFGTAFVSIGLGINVGFRWSEPGAAYQLAGSLLYLVAVIVTIGYHVPHNDALATIDPSRVDAARSWAGYMSGWTAWNHVRAIASIGAAGLFIRASTELARVAHHS